MASFILRAQAQEIWPTQCIPLNSTICDDPNHKSFCDDLCIGNEAVGFYDNTMSTARNKSEECFSKTWNMPGSFQSWAAHPDTWASDTKDYCDYRFDNASYPASVLCYDCGVTEAKERNIALPYTDCKSQGLSRIECMWRCSVEMPECRMVMLSPQLTISGVGGTWEFLFHLPSRPWSHDGHQSDSSMLNELLNNAEAKQITSEDHEIYECSSHDTQASCCRKRMFGWWGIIKNEASQGFRVGDFNSERVQIVAIAQQTLGKAWIWGSSDVLTVPKPVVPVKVGTKNYGTLHKKKKLQGNDTLQGDQDTTPGCTAGSQGIQYIATDPNVADGYVLNAKTDVFFALTGGDNGLFEWNPKDDNAKYCFGSKKRVKSTEPNSYPIFQTQSSENDPDDVCFNHMSAQGYDDYGADGTGKPVKRDALTFDSNHRNNAPDGTDTRFPGLKNKFGLKACTEKPDYYLSHPLEFSDDPILFGQGWEFHAVSPDAHEMAASGEAPTCDIYMVGHFDEKKEDEQLHSSMQASRQCEAVVNVTTECWHIDVESGMCEVKIDIEDKCTPCVFNNTACYHNFDEACKYLDKKACDDLRKTCDYWPKCVPPVPSPDVKKLCNSNCNPGPFVCAFQGERNLRDECRIFATRDDCENTVNENGIKGTWCPGAFDNKDPAALDHLFVV